MIVLLSKISLSQSSEKRLQYLNRIYIELNPSDSLRLMDKERAQFITQTNRLGTKTKSFFEINGNSASLKINQNSNFAFYIQVDNNNIDVSKTYLLFKLTNKKNVRQALWAYQGLSKSKDDSYGLPTLVEKIKDGTFRIKSEKSLDKGEYAFIAYSFQAGENFDAFIFQIQ